MTKNKVPMSSSRAARREERRRQRAADSDNLHDRAAAAQINRELDHKLQTGRIIAATLRPPGSR